MMQIHSGLLDVVCTEQLLMGKDEYLLAVNDANPYKLNANNSSTILTKGKELYTAMCQHCHGEKGDGKGPRS